MSGLEREMWRLTQQQGFFMHTWVLQSCKRSKNWWQELRGEEAGGGALEGRSCASTELEGWFSWQCFIAFVPFLHFLSKENPSGHSQLCRARGTFAPEQSDSYASEDVAREGFCPCFNAFSFNLLRFVEASLKS